MSYKISFYIKLIGIAATISCFQTIAIAKTSVEIDNIAGVVPGSATKLNQQQQFTPIAQNTSLKVEEYNRLAKQKYEKGDYQGALADLNRAIQLEPNDIDAYNNRATLRYHYLKDRFGGIADLQKVAKLVQQRGNQKDAQRVRGIVKQWQLETKKSGNV